MDARCVDSRLAVHERLLSDWDHYVAGRFWTLDPRTLRFKHGESIAELKIPYHLGGEDERIIEDAVVSLAMLIKKRQETEVEDGRKGLDIEDDSGLDLPHDLKAKSYKLDLLNSESAEYRAATMALHTAPLVDGAILVSWLGTNGYGKQFMRWVEVVIDKSLKDEANLETRERTSYIAVFAILNSLKKGWHKIKDLRIKGVSYEKLDLAIAFSIYSAVHAAVFGLLERLESQHVTYYSEGTWTILRSAIVPELFLAIPSNLLYDTHNPYGINKDALKALKGLLPDLSGGEHDLDTIVDTATKKVSSDKELIESINEHYSLSELRRLLVDYLIKFDTPGTAAHKQLYELCQEDRLMLSLVSEGSGRKELIENMQSILKNYFRDKERVGVAESIISFVESIGGSKRGWFGKKVEDTDHLREVIRAVIVIRLDRFAVKFINSMLPAMVDRRGEFQDEMLKQEYKRGRLYRFSGDKRDILISLEVSDEGQLFIDMKDFTKKTFLVKEIAMAEFMKDNFYQPIIAAASAYGAGGGMHETEGGLRLNNLPGDAAIFSGNATNLVALALDMQKVIKIYKDKLDKRLPPVSDDYLVGEINKRFESKKVVLKVKRKDAEKNAREGDKEAQASLKAVKAEEHRLENQYRDELEAAISSEMQAGVFITFGRKAEIMTLDATHNFSSAVTVAIGEKINEAARGTDRNAAVWAKLEMLLENERIRRNNPKLVYPFDVYIDRTHSLRLPFELDGDIDKITTGWSIDIKVVAQHIANEAYGDLAKLSDGLPMSSLRSLEEKTGIYNKGQALSEEAFDAYVRENKGHKFFFTKVVEVSELTDAIREAFFFPKKELELHFSFEVREGMELVECFVKSGELVFKGFESKKPTVAYEMVNKDGPFFHALIESHFKGWLDEVKKGKEDSGLLR